jgi:hypothetical protein
MEHKSHNPDDRPWSHPGDALRRAIETVRQSPPPPQAVERSLERARRIGQPRPHGGGPRRLPLLVSGAVAAVLLIALGLRYGAYPPGGYLAGTRPVKGGDRAALRPDAEPEIDPTKIHAVSRPRLPGHEEFLGNGTEDDLVPVGGSFGSPPDEQERARALRELASGMSAIDRKGIEEHIRRSSGGRREGSLQVRITWKGESPVGFRVTDPNGVRHDIICACQGSGTQVREYRLPRPKPGEYDVQVRLAKSAAARDVEVRVEAVYRSGGRRQVRQETIILPKPGKCVSVAKVRF